MSLPVLLLLIIGLMWLSAVFSGTETGLYGLSRVKLRYRLTRDEPRAKVLDRLLHPIGPTIITILIGNNLANQGLATATEAALRPLGDPWSVLVTVLVLTPLVLVFGEFLPKYLFHRHADRWVYQLVRALQMLRIALAIPVRLVQAATWVIERLLGRKRSGEIWEPHTSRPNLRTFLKAEAGGETLAPIQAELVDRVLALERITLAYEKVSRPLPVVESLDAAARIEAVRKTLGPKFYQRYLVKDHRQGVPSGFVTAVDLVCADGNATVGSLAHKLPILDIALPLHQALTRMHEAGADLCLVRDDTGTISRVAFRGDCVRVLAGLDD